MTLAFLLTCLAVIATPGTGVLYTIATALTAGQRASLVAALGCTLGIVPHMLAAITGLAALLSAFPLAYDALRLLGALYLLYMAVRLWTDASRLAVDAAQTERGIRRIIGRAVLVNLLNPKLSLFFLALLPQFVDPQTEAPLRQMLWLSLVFMGLTFAVFSAYGLLAAGLLRRWLTQPRHLALVRRGFAAGFFALGVKLALD